MANDFLDYAANSIIGLLHNSVRFGGGGNEFVLPFSPVGGGLDDFEISVDYFLNSEEGSYYTGTLSASALMITTLVLFFFLMCSTPCFKCTSCFCCTNLCKNMMVIGGLGLSVFAWFMSVRGNNLIQGGINNGFDDATLLGDLLGNASLALEETLDSRTLFDQRRQEILDECESFAQLVGANLEDIPESSSLDVLEAPQQTIEGVPDQIQDIIDLVTPFLEVISPIYNTFTTVVIAILVTFGLTTTVKVVADRNKKSNDVGTLLSLNNTINTISCCIFFSVGLLLLVLVFIVCIVIAPISTIGADLCIPDISSQVLDILQESTGNVASALDFCQLSDFQSLDTLDLIGGMTCHYTQCQGNNLLFEEAGITITDTNEVEVEALEDLRSEIELMITLLALDASGDICRAALEDGLEFTDGLVELLTPVVLDVECDTLTPLVRSTFDDNLCNGVISGLGVIFVTWTAGGVGMMIAMYFYALLKFERVDEKEELEQAETENPRFSARSHQTANATPQVMYAEPVYANVQPQEEDTYSPKLPNF